MLDYRDGEVRISSCGKEYVFKSDIDGPVRVDATGDSIRISSGHGKGEISFPKESTIVDITKSWEHAYSGSSAVGGSYDRYIDDTGKQMDKETSNFEARFSRNVWKMFLGCGFIGGCAATAYVHFQPYPTSTGEAITRVLTGAIGGAIVLGVPIYTAMEKIMRRGFKEYMYNKYTSDYVTCPDGTRMRRDDYAAKYTRKP